MFKGDKQRRGKAIVRYLIYGFLCILIAFGIVAKCVHYHYVSKYQNGKQRLETILEKDKRFQNVKVFFTPTRPSVFVLAPRDLPLSVQQDLQRIVTAVFAPLPAPVYFKDEMVQQTTNVVPSNQSPR
ncbi:MAG: hypothetical protein ACLQVY_18505 [Limisphaerales bacterium]